MVSAAADFLDDGPTVDAQYGTSQLVEKLAEVDAKATFYIVGTNAIQFPDIVRAVDAAGHEIGSHTWTHHPLTSLTNEQIVAGVFTVVTSRNQVHRGCYFRGNRKSSQNTSTSVW